MTLENRLKNNAGNQEFSVIIFFPIADPFYNANFTTITPTMQRVPPVPIPDIGSRVCRINDPASDIPVT